MPHQVARRLYDLIEPIALVNFFSDEPNESMRELGFRNYWDGYFAGRSAPLGRVPAEVVDAAFYSFADGEVARHIPKVWETTTPEAAHAARERGCVAALRRILGDLVETPGFADAAELWRGPRPAHRPGDGSCTPRCAHCRCPRSRWPGSGTQPTCCASTAVTVTSSRW